MLWVCPGLAFGDRMCTDTASNASSGTLTDSGGSGGRYQNFEDCSFTISASPGDTITLSFSAFDYENFYDTLKVYDGTSAASPSLGSLTGSSLPADLVANSGSMHIVHDSDFSITDDGFVASWNVTAAGSSCRLETVADSFSSLAYNLNSGTASWRTDWLEVGEAD